jgi:RNA polymerase sigma-70 factor, ECF subfamily
MAAAGSNDEPGDDALMALAAADQSRAYVRLVERYQRRVRGFCRVLLRDEALAHDIAQEVFLKIWKRRAQYRPQGRFKEFLFTVARNECRSAARRRLLPELFGWPPSSERVELEASAPEDPADERLQIVLAALLRLPEKFRVPLSLRFLEGLDYAQIARVIGRSESAARSRVFYGLKQLAAAVPEEVLP